MIRQKNPERTFIPGDKWLYYKFYTGSKMSEFILKEVIKPLTENFIFENIIDKWFFVRYADPEIHLRVRFHCAASYSLSKIINKINIAIKPYIQNNLVWKVQIDTYQREIERYGPEYIEIAEKIFYFDSVMIINMLALIDGDEGEVLRWHFALKSLDVLLNDLGFDQNGKLELLGNLKESYAKEFGMNRRLKKQIDNKYREESKTILKLIAAEKEFLNTDIMNLLRQRSKSNRPLIKQIHEENNADQNINNLLSSIIHMSMNRIFMSKQRMHEMMIYDFLFRYFKSVIARGNKIK